MLRLQTKMQSVFTILILCVMVSLSWSQTTETSTNRLEQRRTLDEFLDVCMLGTNHKAKPSPDAGLNPTCSPWKDRSCCRQNTTDAFHEGTSWYNLEWNHCPGHTMSAKCRKHFLQDLCFYECSPNVGPWLVSVNKKWTTERFQNVPLCESECTSWWNDCKSEYTCRDNWYKGFDWLTGTNTCPPDTECKTFELVFGTSKKFCEQLWDHSWQVVPDTESCMHLTWTAGANPNDVVARKKALEYVKLINGATTIANGVSIGTLIVTMLMLF